MGEIVRIAFHLFLAAALIGGGASSAVAENGANDYLLAASSSQQATVLGQAVGEGCKGNKAFYMGIGKEGIAKDQGFWSVRCSDGRSFAVMVYPDGSSQVLDCKTLAAVGGGTCFKKLPN